MSTGSSDSQRPGWGLLAPAVSLLIGIIAAVPATGFLLHAAPLQRPLREAVLQERVRDSMDDYGGLVYRTLREHSTPKSPREVEVFFTGSSVMGFSVNVPLLRSQVEDRFPGHRIRVENFWAQNATASDTLLWLKQLPPGRPKILVYGLYYKALEPSKRKPHVRHLFPLNNASFVKTLFAAHTVDRQKSWDPNGAPPPTDGFWNPPIWQPSMGQGAVGEDLLPLDRLPNSETRALSELVEVCQARDVRLVVIRTPIHPGLLREYHRVIDREAYERLFQSLPADVPVWNWETLIDDPAAFVNLQHTSGVGRDRCTSELATQIPPVLERAMTGN